MCFSFPTIEFVYSMSVVLNFSNSVDLSVFKEGIH